MDAAEIDALQEDDQFYTDIGSGIWLMDDHKWAFYVWHRFHMESRIPKLSLVHADYHWDGGNDFHESPEKLEEFLDADDEALLELIREENWIRFVYCSCNTPWIHRRGAFLVQTGRRLRRGY